MFSANASQVSTAANYIEDVFSTYLYTGNGSTQTITNGIDLAGKGGLVIKKSRSTTGAPTWNDSARGLSNGFLRSDATSAASGSTNIITAFNSNGFDVGGSGSNLDDTYASWTFRKQQNFFDVVTYTGNGSTLQTISHNLGSVPGCIIIKSTSSASWNWIVYHRSLGITQKIQLNLTDAAVSENGNFGGTSPTSTAFSVGYNATNQSGGTYVAYLFAHDAGGFGLTGTDNVISCGSGSWSGGSDNVVNLGYEVQWLMYKSTDIAGSNWMMWDTMRGMSLTASEFLRANLSDAAGTYNSPYAIYPTATGFTVPAGLVSTGNYIYIAIRRGPMAVPTTGTSVFAPTATSAATGTALTTGFPVDMQIAKFRSFVYDNYLMDRLRGVITTTSNTASPYLFTDTTGAEASVDVVTRNWGNTGFEMSGNFGTNSTIFYSFGRAPSFFDVVCYTGNGVTRDINHNLGVTPEFYIVKQRSGGTSTSGWATGGTVYPNSTDYYTPLLNSTQASIQVPNAWRAPTSTTFGIGTAYPADNTWNYSGAKYVAYLFASCPGVSKVGSYTGNGSTQTISCGFAGGARFVLIKRTDSTGDWYVYDTARGMTTLTDPYLLLNSTAAESATLGSVTTVTTGFAVNASILAAINTNGASYIFLAIA